MLTFPGEVYKSGTTHGETWDIARQKCKYIDADLVLIQDGDYLLWVSSFEFLKCYHKVTKPLSHGCQQYRASVSGSCKVFKGVP